VVNPNTGVITGRPTAPRATATYTTQAFTAQVGGTLVNTNVTITVDAVGPGVISYGAAAFTFTAGIPGTTVAPQAGSPVSGWSIGPQPPPGLTFSTVDGSISGTPTAASPRTSYTVTAQGSAGTLSVTFAIEVDTDVLVDLGHAAAIQSLQFDGSSVLSEDTDGHWVLWNYGTGTMIASGDAGNVFPGYVSPGDNLNEVLASPVTALAGATAVIRTPTGLEVRSAATGALNASIGSTPSWWSLAPDGSYIVAGDPKGLSVWSPAGQLLISRSGYYGNAIAFAAAGTILIAEGAAGMNVVEAVSVPSGTDVVSPQFLGNFTSWLADGSGFLSTAIGSGTTPTKLFVYSDSAVQEASVTNDNANYYGEGQWLWTAGVPAPTGVGVTTLTLYALTSPTTPVATYTFGSGLAVVSGSTIGVYDSTVGKLSVIDLSGSAPVKTDYPLPFGTSDAMHTYAATSASQWIAGYVSGVLLDGASLPGAPRLFDYGRSLSVAGSAGRIAIATASGRILYFNAVTLAKEGTISFSFDPTAQYFASPQLALSSDGSTLAFLGPQGTSVNIYSMPSGSLLYSWPYPLSAGWLAQGISLSGSGTVLGTSSQYLYNYNPQGTLMQTASPATGGAPIFTSQWGSGFQYPPPIRMSPDGTQIATSSWYNPDFFSGAPISTKIMKGGVLVPFVSGWPVGWIDNSHLLVTTYVVDAKSSSVADYAGCTIYDLSGNATGACVLPEVLGFQTVDSDTLYALNLPKTVSISTGAVSWQSGNPPPCQPANFQLLLPCFQNALAGNHVVLVSDSRVVVQSY
jgi:hypothetical protein